MSYTAPDFKTQHTLNDSPRGKNSNAGSLFEEEKFDLDCLSSYSGTSGARSSVTQTVTIGLCGLAGRPNLSMNESEAWILDPRTPMKKFGALLFKLANIRQQIFKQINREFLEVHTMKGEQTSTSTPSTVENQDVTFSGFSLASLTPSTKEESDSYVSVNKESWYSDFVNPVLNRLFEDGVTLAKLGPLVINKN